MAVNTFGPTSAQLPAGAVERMGGGFTRNGYASFTGNFPAGQYLIKSSAPATAHLGANVDDRRFTATGKQGNTDIVLATTQNLNCFEYISQAYGGTYTNISSFINQNTGSLTTAFNNPSVYQYNATAYWPTTMPQPLFHFQGALYGLTGSALYRNTTGQFTSWTAISGTYNATNTTATVATNGVTVVAVSSTTVYYNSAPASSAVFSTTTLATGVSGVTAGNGIFIAYGGSSTAYTSPDGINWTSRTYPTTFAGITYGNGLFIGFVNLSNNIYYSTDAITWTLVTIPFLGSTSVAYLNHISFVNGVFVAAPTSGGTTVAGTGNFNCLYSTDGITWLPGASYGIWNFAGSGAISHTMYNIGNYGVLVNNNVTTQVALSQDGQHTVHQNLGAGMVGATTVGSGQVIPGGNRGYMLTSSTGIFMNFKAPNCYFDVYRLDPSFKIYS